MQIFEFQINPETLELFPPEVCNSARIAFHGTVTSYSEKIEQNGFQRKKSAYNVVQANALIDLLQTPEFSVYDVKRNVNPFFPDWSQTIAENIKEYIANSQHDDYRISFAALSSDCLSFTNNAETKGGQGYVAIRRTKKIIEQAVSENPSLGSIIPDLVHELFTETVRLEGVEGVIYAVEMPQNINALEFDERKGIIWCSEPILANAIIAKVIVPQEVIIPQQSISETVRRRKQMRSGMLIALARNSQSQNSSD